ncbi:MAG: class I SAM-dependent methyltransferase [Halioglobus sp.]
MRGFEPRHRAFSTWVDHISFGFDIVEAVAPKRLVELGAYNGMSYFVFCQSMIDNDVDGVCYAVDTWGGDDHTGDYDESVYDDVRVHSRTHYRGISYLMRMLFNDALPNFEDDSIDLLHIDGLHTYEAVQEDFTNWYPKVRPGGVILFHDIEARQSDFGVWKYWAELEEKHDTFAFHHGFGLGVLRKEGGPATDHPLLELLFNSSEVEQHRLRQLYIHNSEYIEARNKAKRLQWGPKHGGDGKPKHVRQQRKERLEAEEAEKPAGDETQIIPPAESS